MQLSVAIMAIPARRNHVYRFLLPALQAAGIKPTLCMDIQRQGLWWNAKRAWLAIQPGASHQLVLQDDILLSPYFFETVQLILERHPQKLISFFSGNREAIATADRQGYHWATLQEVCWAPALCLPVEWVYDWLRWDSLHVQPEYKHDDGRLSLWSYVMGHPCWYTVPSLVEHVGGHASSMGHNFGLQANRFIGKEDPRGWDWSAECGVVTRHAKLLDRPDYANALKEALHR